MSLASLVEVIHLGFVLLQIFVPLYVIISGKKALVRPYLVTMLMVVVQWSLLGGRCMVTDLERKLRKDNSIDLSLFYRILEKQTGINRHKASDFVSFLMVVYVVIFMVRYKSERPWGLMVIVFIALAQFQIKMKRQKFFVLVNYQL